jgi:hypothetical protein
VSLGCTPHQRPSSAEKRTAPAVVAARSADPLTPATNADKLAEHTAADTTTTTTLSWLAALRHTGIQHPIPGCTGKTFRP